MRRNRGFVPTDLTTRTAGRPKPVATAPPGLGCVAGAGRAAGSSSRFPIARSPLPGAGSALPPGTVSRPVRGPGAEERPTATELEPAWASAGLRACRASRGRCRRVGESAVGAWCSWGRSCRTAWIGSPSHPGRPRAEASLKPQRPRAWPAVRRGSRTTSPMAESRSAVGCSTFFSLRPRVNASQTRWFG